MARALAQKLESSEMSRIQCGESENRSAMTMEQAEEEDDGDAAERSPDLLELLDAAVC